MASTEMPIVGFDGDQPNDSFRDQLVMNAKSAIDKIGGGVETETELVLVDILMELYDVNHWHTPIYLLLE